MPQPTAKFFPQDKMSVVFGPLTIHCSYWVAWGDDRWHAKIERAEDATGGLPPGFDRLRELVTEALRGGKSRQIMVEGSEGIPGSPAAASQAPIQPPVPTRGNGPKIV